MSARFYRLDVSKVIAETADCKSFELAVPPELEHAFRYDAGQHLTLQIPWKDFAVNRCYSLSSSPDVDATMRIAVKRVAGGRVSNWMNDRLRVGDAILASVPEGRFVLDSHTKPSMPLFLFAGGSGITPVVSLLKSALQRTRRDVALVYASADRDSMIYGDEIRAIAEENPDRVALHLHFDDESGYLTAETLRARVRGYEHGEFYVCGPEPFMELVETVLAAVDVPQPLIHIERFVSPVDPDRAPIDEPPTDAEAPANAPEGFSLWLDGRSRTVPYIPGRTLLECARDADLHPASSCESGFCGSCMAHLNTGKVHMRTHEALSDRDLERGVVLLCQSVPATADPLEVDCDSISFRAPAAVRSSLAGRASRFAAAAVFALMVAGTLVLRLGP